MASGVAEAPRDAENKIRVSIYFARKKSTPARSGSDGPARRCRSGLVWFLAPVAGAPGLYSINSREVYDKKSIETRTPIMTGDRQQIADNLAAVEERLCAACRRADRERNEVTLIAVTKTVSVEIAALLPELGVYDLGESRPQELWRKAAALAGVRWHLVGHLQRNKIERTLPLVHRLHSVDSLRLLDALEEACRKSARALPALLEVNASREVSKHGFTPEEAPRLAARLAELKHVRIEGLMTMAAYEEDPERTRPTFASLRTLRDRLAAELGRPLPQLSMGMSNDFEIAVEEGATLVRLGTVLFQGIDGR
jgi:pyridoxal phosphate enzyme (YggS family)